MFQRMLKCVFLMGVFILAVQLDANNWRAYQGMGHSYYRAGKVQDAIKAYDASLKLNPGNAELQKFVDTLKSSQPVAVTASTGYPQKNAKSKSKSGKKVRFGIEAGFQMCKLMESSSDASATTKAVLKPAFGGFLQIKMSNKISFCPELLYVGKGGKSNSTDSYDYYSVSEIYEYDTKDNLNYLEFPMLFRFYPSGDHHLNCIFGPSIGILMSANFKETITYQETVNGVVVSQGTESASGDMKSACSSTDLGLILGAGYEAGSLNFDLRMDIGLSNIDKNSSSGNSWTNITAGLFVGYMF